MVVSEGQPSEEVKGSTLQPFNTSRVSIYVSPSASLARINKNTVNNQRRIRKGAAHHVLLRTFHLFPCAGRAHGWLEPRDAKTAFSTETAYAFLS